MWKYVRAAISSGTGDRASGRGGEGEGEGEGKGSGLAEGLLVLV